MLKSFGALFLNGLTSQDPGLRKTLRPLLDAVDGRGL